jgi:uncharacterized protein with PIN domain
MSEKMVLCENCRKKVSFSVRDENVVTNIKGREIKFSGKVACCDNCGEEVYVPEVEKNNLETLKRNI